MKLQEKNTVKKLFFVPLLFIAFGSLAQQGLQMDFTEQDSVQMELQRQMEYRQLISGNALNPGLMDEKMELPNFDFKAEYTKRYTLNLNIDPITHYHFSGFSSGMTNPFYMPFYGNTKVLSAAEYQLGNKFTLGGYSYGANSIFSSPNLNPGMNNFDSYGSTLFMQYNVSKHFKIETRINVMQGGQHPAF